LDKYNIFTDLVLHERKLRSEEKEHDKSILVFLLSYLTSEMDGKEEL
jgi:hypothetical protein